VVGVQVPVEFGSECQDALLRVLVGKFSHVVAGFLAK